MNTVSSYAVHAPRLRAWQTFALFVGVLGELFLAGDWYGFAAVMPFVSHALALSPAEAGFAQGAFAITYGVGMCVWSPLGRTLSARVLFAVGLLGAGLAMFWQSHAASYAMLIALRLVIGFFDAAVWVGTMKLIVGWFPPRRHGFTMGVLLAAFSLAITLDFAIGIPVSEAFGWRTFFAALGVATCAVGAFGALAIRGGPREIGYADFRWDDEAGHAHAHTHNEAPRQAVSIWAVFRSKWLYVGALAIFGDMFAISAVTTWVVPAFIEVQHMPVPAAATVGATMGFAQVVVLLVGGWLSDRMPRTAMLKVGAACCVAAALAFVATTLVRIEWSGLLAISAFSGVVVLSGGAIFSLVSEKYGEALAASAIGFAELGGIVSTFVAPALLGAVIGATQSFAVAFGVFAAVEVLIFVALLVVAR
ncbi:MFS transporter [Paraburkholderia acidisoli]|uniref:MFS transporter n=1 Tax=Paraburkholderia acidisoli TaxID=2571748 RepID=A0A7Z2GNK6_9BURK|nr:MFS transporter [Paraburkholderia acidisoli]QGZ65023.1 MFS transporter [Paraburkholderia acidisoli]